MKGNIVYGLNALGVKLSRKCDRPVHLEVGLAKGNVAANFCRQRSQLGSTCCLVATRTWNRNATSGERRQTFDARTLEPSFPEILGASLYGMCGKPGGLDWLGSPLNSISWIGRRSTAQP